MAIEVIEGGHPNGMDLVMPDAGDVYTGRWRGCEICGKRMLASDYEGHVESHLKRPYQDAMTLVEVAEALGCAYRTIMDCVNAGKLRAVKIPMGKVRIWVRKNALKEFVRERVERKPELAVKYAATGLLK